MVKRLHDRNRPGLIAAIFWAPIIAITTGQHFGFTQELAKVGDRLMHVPNTLSMTILGVGMIVFVWAFVELCCLRGTRGPNKYGHDPQP